MHIGKYVNNYSIIFVFTALFVHIYHINNSGAHCILHIWIVTFSIGLTFMCVCVFA